MVATQLTALLFTDIVDSTRVTKELGDFDYELQFRRPHNERFRELLAHFPSGAELRNTGDGFFAKFASVHDAVSFALLFHQVLRRNAWTKATPQVRIGIHLGDVTLDLQDKDGPGGNAINLCNRVMSLGGAGQTLLSRAAFDSARQTLRKPPQLPGATDSGPAELEWLAHGRYRFKGSEEEPLEIFEVGTVGLAPLQAPPDSEKVKRALSLDEELTLGWRPAIEREVPSRNGWILREELGRGGFGEVWLGENKRTKEKRVFKFCFDTDRLRSFKRELTLFKLIQTGLGERSDIVQLREVQVDRMPYFLESEYLPAGNLAQWFERQGGIRAVPLSVRLAILAQVARAVGAAHSLGIIHKDIKPSNILVDEAAPVPSAAPRVKLADFGIGVLADRTALAAHGVTETGFTESILVGNDSSRTGTRLYSPPEAALGKPASTNGDIYALGVMLYQFAAGDLERPLGVGWEGDITDPLLREDIASCTQGDASKRLTSAEDLAVRLETLTERRAERTAREQREVVRRRAARRRVWLTTGTLILMLSLVIIAIILQADAKRARAELRALTDAKVAQDRLVRVRKTVDVYLTDVSESLKYYAGGQAYRKAMLQDVEHHYEELAKEEREQGRELAADFKFERALNFMRLGDLERQRGERSAVATYLRAETLLAELLQGEPKARMRDEWVQCRVRALVAKDEEDYSAALKLLEETRKQLTGESEENREGRAYCLANEGAIHLFCDDLKRAHPLLDEAVELASRLLKDTVRGGPRDLEQRHKHIRRTRNLATAEKDLGQVLSRQGKLAAGRTSILSSINRFEELLRDDKQHPGHLEELVAARMAFCDVLRRQADYVEAEKEFKETIEAYQRLNEALPDVLTLQERLGVVYVAFAQLYFDQGLTQQAVSNAEAADEIFGKIAGLRGSANTFRFRRALASDILGESLRDGSPNRDDLLLAIKLFAAANDDLQGMDSVGALETQAIIRSHEAQLLERLAAEDSDPAVKTQHFADAEEHYRKSIDGLEQVAEKSITAKHALALVHSYFGDFLHRQSKQEASEQYHQAVDRWSTLAEESEVVPEVLNRFTWFLANCPDPELRNLSKAELLMRKTISSTSPCPGFRCTEALIAVRLGQFDRAVELLESMRRMEEGREGYEGHVLTLLAITRFKQQPKEAADLLQLARQKCRPGNRDVSQLIAEATELIEAATTAETSQP